MDINDIRVAVTVASLLLFVALMVHTWSRRRTAEHDAAAQLPFTGGDDAPVQQPTQKNRIQGEVA